MEKELEWLAAAFEEVMSSDVLLMDGMMRYVSTAQGKLLRPRLVFLSARLLGGINDTTRRTALFVEMLHMATLIHDDVVDGSDTRRGQASLNARCDNRSAVLAGDYLLAKAVMQLSEPSDNRILKEMLNVAMAMSEGELLQFKVERSALKVGSEAAQTYIDIITRKTARLIRTCCVSGAISVGASQEIIDKVGEYGLNLGLVFQMRDDILDRDNPETTALAERLLPEYLDKALKALDALTPYIINQESFSSLKELTMFCAERNH